MLVTPRRPSRKAHVHHEEGQKLTAALAAACALPPLELACATALATALLLVLRQFRMGWLLAAACAKALASPLDCARAAASAGNTPKLKQDAKTAQAGRQSCGIGMLCKTFQPPQRLHRIAVRIMRVYCIQVTLKRCGSAGPFCYLEVIAHARNHCRLRPAMTQHHVTMLGWCDVAPDAHWPGLCCQSICPGRGMRGGPKGTAWSRHGWVMAQSTHGSGGGIHSPCT